ncbi:MAG: hypothetical protein CL928_07240 [Deltaproteobacteria bacterium]|nr:hypothetical protein [Deltaproteobacteria bacterium]
MSLNTFFASLPHEILVQYRDLYLDGERGSAAPPLPAGVVTLSDEQVTTYATDLATLFADPKWVRRRMRGMSRSAHVALVGLLHSQGIGGGTWLLQELTQSHGMSEDLWAEVLHSLGTELWVFGNSRQSPPLFYVIPARLAEVLQHQFGRRLKLQGTQTDEEIRLSPDTNYRHPLGFSIISFLTYLRQNRIRVTRKGEIFKKNLEELSSFFSSLWGSGDEEKILEWHLDVVQELGLCCHREGFLVADDRAIEGFLAAGPDARRTLYLSYFLHREPLLGWLLEELHRLEPDEWVPLQRIRTLYRRRYMGGVFHRRYVRQSYYLPPSGFYDPNPPLEVIQLAGLLESGLGSEGSYVRLSELGRRFISGEGFQELESREGIQFMVQPNFEVLAPVGLDLSVLWKLGELASLQQVDRANTYTLSRESVREGLSTGLRSEEALTFLSDESATELPQNVVSTITDWIGSHGEVELHDALVLSALPTRAAAVRKVLVAEGVQFESLSDTVFAIPREKQETVLKALQAKGMSPAPSVRRHDLADALGTQHKLPGRLDEPLDRNEPQRSSFPVKSLVMLGAPAAEGGKEAMARRGFRTGKVGANAVGADLSVKPAAAGAGALLKLSPAKTISVVKAAIRLKLDLEVLYPSTEESDPGGLSRVTPIEVQEAGGSSFFSGHHHGLDREVEFRIKRIHGIRLAT